MLLNNDIKHILGSLQLSKGHDAGGEAVISAMYESFFEENTESVSLINPENVFSPINRKVKLYNMNFLCTLISTCI